MKSVEEISKIDRFVVLGVRFHIYFAVIAKKSLIFLVLNLMDLQ
jgi:hypothetical protein